MRLIPLPEAEVHAAAIAVPRLAAEAVARGLVPHAFLGLQRLRSVLQGLPSELLVKFGADRARGALCAALAYGDGPSQPPTWARERPLARLGRFVRSDWYAELAARLRVAGIVARDALSAAGIDPGPGRDWRYLANSGLPERPLALAAGLGSLGRNGLLLARGVGPGVVLGLLLLPFDPEAAVSAAAGGQSLDPHRPGEDCGSCQACREACPTGAIRAEGGIERVRCLQYWAARPGSLPPAIEAAWGGLLYGCDVCIEACPRFQPGRASAGERGALGPGLSARSLLEFPESELRSRLRGTALGLGWIDVDALRRSASLVLAAAERRHI